MAKFDAAIAELSRGDRRRKNDCEINIDAVRRDISIAVDCYLGNKKAWSLPKATRLATYRKVHKTIQSARIQIEDITLDAALRAPLIATDTEYAATELSWRKLVPLLKKLEARLRKAEDQAGTSVRRGRTKSGHVEFLFGCLSNIYFQQTGLEPGRSQRAGKGKTVSGPFVRFAQAVFHEIEPGRPTDMGASIAKAVQRWKKQTGRAGYKYQSKFP